LDESNFIFATSNGLLQFNLERRSFYRPFPEDNLSCNSIIKVNEETLLTTAGVGIYIYSFNKNDKNFEYELKRIMYPNIPFNSCAIDVLGDLWLGTLNKGVIHVDNVVNFVNGEAFESSEFATESGFLRTSYILSTQDHGCWVGSFNKGLFQFDLYKNPFHHFSSRMKYKYGLATDEVLQVVVYDSSRVILSANNGGVALLNTATNAYEAIPFDITPEFELTTLVFLIDSRDDIWVWQGDNLGVVKRSKGQRKVLEIDSDAFPVLRGLSPSKLIEDKYGNIWMGSVDGLYKLILNADGQLIRIEALDEHPLFKNNHLSHITNIYIDPLYDFMWIGTRTSGLLQIKMDEDKPLKEIEVSHYSHNPADSHSVSSDFVRAIKRLPNGELWIGTEGGGINKIVGSETEHPEFIAFSEKDGLSNNVVKRILYDGSNNLWISTNIGLNKFDTKDLRFTVYSSQDGLPFDDFLYSAVSLENGYMLFSGSVGILYFNPSEIRKEKLLPKVTFGDVTVFNRTVHPGDILNKRVLLDKRLIKGDELVLKHDENVFSIELLSLHYSTPENRFIKYRLLPLNEEWIEVPSSQRNISYNSLQPDNYQLEVKVSNTQNQWTEPTTLTIIITPPFWITVPAFILYFLLLVLIAYSIFHYLLRLNKLKHKVEIEQLEKEKVEAVNEGKLRFFSNISHEIKTPLTLISGPVNILAERFKANDDVREKIQIIQRQSYKMLRLVNQVHDFQRSDANELKMNYSQFCFDDFLDELLIDFRFKADVDKKHLVINRNNNRIFVSADNDKLEKIINNLLSNAFKFTRIGDTITIDYRNEGNKLLLNVIDTGRGIDSDDLPHVFELFYQAKNHSEYTGGSGIGLAFTKRLVEMHYGYIAVKSEFGKGSKFIISLPVISEENVVTDVEIVERILDAEKQLDVYNSEIENINLANIEVDQEFKNAQIFFAEDNTDIRRYISGILSNFFNITSFTNGRECLEAMKKEWPELVISDVIMPEMNGFDLCKHIKSDIKTSHIPVILLTACSTVEEQLEGIKVGADSYINKPFSIQHLVTRVENLLRNRKKLRERFQIDLPLVLEKQDDQNSDMDFLEKLYCIMEKNLDNENLDLDQIAKELYLNRTHFYHKIKALTNQTPFEFFKNYRLKKAADLLVQKQLLVNEVYVITGFKSRTHFNKSFKEKYGITPGKYAVEIAKKNLS
jgi:signal transduction histidine kinase/DNA-binding response OmpR family regulator/ligand-binding sensor domain-containing protein